MVHLVPDVSVNCFLFFDAFPIRSSQTFLALSPLFVFKPPYRLSASGKHRRGVPGWPHYGRIKVERSDTV